MQAEGFINAAFEGESQNGDVGTEIFDDVDLTNDSPPPDTVNRDEGHIQSKEALTNNNTNSTHQHNGNSSHKQEVNSTPVQNGNTAHAQNSAHAQNNGVKRPARTSINNNKQNNAEIPVVFVGARNIEVRHESQDYVRTEDGFDNPVYEGQRSSIAGLDNKEDGRKGCCNCKCILIFALIFIIIALVAVTLIFLFLPKPRKYLFN